MEPIIASNIILFDFDGTLSTPVFSSIDGAILPGQNTFADNFSLYQPKMHGDLISLNPYQRQQPVVGMPEIIDRLSRLEDVDLGVLSTCGQGSVEIFAKLEWLEHFYSSYDISDWKRCFYGVCKTEHKIDVIYRLYQEEYSKIIYVDDNLESLITIEQELRNRITDFNALYKHIKLYHVTTFIQKINGIIDKNFA